AEGRTVDIAVGEVNQHKALLALTSNGLSIFDGEKWTAVGNAPAKGRTIALRSVAGVQYVFIAGSEGVKAGRIDADAQWIPSEAPDALYAAVYGSSRSSHDLLFLTSRQQREILVG